MRDITLQELLEAGCHFGHQANRWHPKAGSYIYDKRGGVHIIDLAKTREYLIAAGNYLSDLAKNDGAVIFVGVKRQAQEIVQEAAKKAGVYYVTQRWPGGLLTNYAVLAKNLSRIEELKARINDERYTKKERLLSQREMNKLLAQYGGLIGMTKLPDAVFLVDVKKLAGAVREANSRGVKVVAIADTNIDPTPIDYAIPANDDAVGSIKIVTDYLADCWIAGKAVASKEQPEEKTEATTEKKVQ